VRVDIAFPTTDGVKLRGWRYWPDSGEGPFPTIVLAHGFSAVKEMALDRFAETFAAAGLASVVFDHRGFGASEGTPRQEIDPWLQVRDYCDAITFAAGLADTDPARIGVWGSSYSGGHVLVVGAIDRRVKCVVSQVPHISGYEGFRRLVRADLVPLYEAQFHADRQARAGGAAPATVAVVADDPATPAALATADSFAWFSEMAETVAPAWRNKVTVRSLEYGFGYEPGDYIARLSPTPLLMIVAKEDRVAVSDLAIRAHARALEPKKLILIPGGHFDAYGPAFEAAAEAAADWFRVNLPS
jgi:uncharacterized protein